MIKAVLIDFDGTLVTRDILDLICGIVGKEKTSEKINQEYYAGKRVGINPLIDRINLLQGVTLSQIQQKLQENTFLIKGATELINYLNENHIISILNSGNIMPVLQYYQRILRITYMIGTQPVLEGEVIKVMTSKDFPERNYRVKRINQLLAELSVKPHETLAIGDSPSDKKIFAIAGTSIAINPKAGIEKYADYVIESNLFEAIRIIKMLNGI